jgi:hypothetical protein
MNFEKALGELIGVGASRLVYINLLDNKTVIKVQRLKTLKKNNILNNLIEWQTWNQYLKTRYQELFCPCHMISQDGKFLIQSYAQVLEPGKHLKRSRLQWSQLPTSIQQYADSRWYKNWGRLENRYVLIDYGRENADRIEK